MPNIDDYLRKKMKEIGTCRFLPWFTAHLKFDIYLQLSLKRELEFLDGSKSSAQCHDWAPCYVRL